MWFSLVCSTKPGEFHLDMCVSNGPSPLSEPVLYRSEDGVLPEGVRHDTPEVLEYIGVELINQAYGQ